MQPEDLQPFCRSHLILVQIFRAVIGQTPIARDADFVWSFIADSESTDFDQEGLAMALEVLQLTEEQFRSEVERIEGVGGPAAVHELLVDDEDTIWTITWLALLVTVR